MLAALKLTLAETGRIFRETAAPLKHDAVFLALMAIFTLAYLPHVFLMVEDVGFVASYEVDPGSHMLAIEDLLDSYNMLAPYHSRYYGWTYFALNVVLLEPLHWFNLLFHLADKTPLYLAIRMILFTIGLLSTAVFYALLKSIFNGRFLPLLGALLYITSPTGAKHFYFIHPETTGTLFVLMAGIFLIRYAKLQSAARTYYPFLICLVLASLSKQVFFFVSLLMMAGFYLVHCRNTGLQPWRFLMAKHFIQTLLFSAMIALGLAFIINPFAFIHFHKFLGYQAELGVFITSDYALSVRDSVIAWLNVIKAVPLMLACACLAVPYLIGSVALRGRPGVFHLLAALNGIGVILIVALVIAGNRLVTDPAYFQPIYPFIIIVFLTVWHWVLHLPPRWARLAGTAGLAYLSVLIVMVSIYIVAPANLKRFAYKQSISYQTFRYIQDNFSANARIAYDQFAAMPAAYRATSCHYWQGCGTDYIETFKPDYIMVNENYAIDGRTPAETARLLRYTKDHDFILVTRIKGSEDTESVYKKP